MNVETYEHLVIRDGVYWKIRRVWIDGEYIGQYAYISPIQPEGNK